MAEEKHQGFQSHSNPAMGPGCKKCGAEIPRTGRPGRPAEVCAKCRRGPKDSCPDCGGETRRKGRRCAGCYVKARALKLLTCVVCQGVYTFKVHPSRFTCSPACSAKQRARARRAWLDKPETRARRLYSVAKQRAKAQGIPFDLQIRDVVEKFKRGVCEATGMALDLTGSDEQHVTPFSPSLDRIDPSKGYVTSNVQVVCMAYNTAKNQWDHQDVLKLARALVSRYGA